MSERSRGRDGGERPTRRRRARGEDYDEDRGGDDNRFDEEESPHRSGSRRSGSSRGHRGRPEKKRSFFGLFGSRSGSRRGLPSRSSQRFDWGEDEDDQPHGDERHVGGDRGGDSYEEEAPRSSRRRSRGRSAVREQTLMDLCTPVFGFATLLPQEPSEAQPTYKQFRDEAVAALKRIQDQASEHGIETEDARLAAYALSLFLDEQVVGSEWTGKNEWVAAARDGHFHCRLRCRLCDVCRYSVNPAVDWSFGRLARARNAAELLDSFG
jgi:hypothetical protein